MSGYCDSGNTVAHSLEAKGYAIARGIFQRHDIRLLSSEFDRFYEKGLQYSGSFRHQNQLYVIREDLNLGRVLRYVQWPAYTSQIFSRFRTDVRILNLLRPLIGDTLKQIANQLSWKTPGTDQTTFAFHQDCRFRRPRRAYRDLETSYVQTAVAIDPHTPANGCLRVYPGSHRLGDLGLNIDRSVMEGGCDEQSLLHYGLDPANLVDLVLEPGDVALWTPFLVHGSGPNRSSLDRRFMINGYIRAEKCDLGEWAFIGGKPCQLMDPVPVQYEDLYSKPEPHYVAGDPHPYREGSPASRQGHT